MIDALAIVLIWATLTRLVSYPIIQVVYTETIKRVNTPTKSEFEEMFDRCMNGNYDPVKNRKENFY